MEEDPDGEWVKFEEATSLLGVEIACNCAEESEEKRVTYCRDIASDAWWICPAHGYKRL